MAIPKKLTDKIENFLRDRSVSDGGYAPVGEKDLQQLQLIFGDLIKTKYEQDPDGDLPVGMELVDRTKYQMSYFSQIPHLHSTDGDVKQALRALRLATANLDIAQSQVKRISDRLSEEVGQQMEQGRVLKFGDTTYERSMPHVDSKRELLEQVKQTFIEMMEECPPSLELINDYSQKQEWVDALQKSLSNQYNTCIGISAYTQRNNDKVFRVIVRLEGVATKQDNEPPATAFDMPYTQPKMVAKKRLKP